MPSPRISDSVDMGWGPRICISNKLRSDVDLLNKTYRLTISSNPFSYALESGTGDLLFPNKEYPDRQIGFYF